MIRTLQTAMLDAMVSVAKSFGLSGVILVRILPLEHGDDECHNFVGKVPPELSDALVARAIQASDDVLSGLQISQVVRGALMCLKFKNKKDTVVLVFVPTRGGYQYHHNAVLVAGRLAAVGVTVVPRPRMSAFLTTFLDLMPTQRKHVKNAKKHVRMES